MRIFEIFFYSSSQSTLLSFSPTVLSKGKLLFFREWQLNASRKQAWEYTVKFTLHQFSRQSPTLRENPTHSSGAQLKDFTISIIYTILILGVRVIPVSYTQSLLKQHQGKNLKCLKVILSILLVQSAYVVMVTRGRSNRRPWRRNLLCGPWGSSAWLPSPEPSCQDHSMPVGGTREQEALSSLSRLNYRGGWLLFPTVSLLLLLLTKGLRTRISPHELDKGKRHNCREKVPLPSTLILKGLAVQARLFPLLHLSFGNLYFSFLNLLCIFFHI